MAPSRYVTTAARQVARGYESDYAFMAALLLALGLLAVVVHLSLLRILPLPVLL
jgi:hypothetical protein